MHSFLNVATFVPESSTNATFKSKMNTQIKNYGAFKTYTRSFFRELKNGKAEIRCEIQTGTTFGKTYTSISWYVRYIEMPCFMGILTKESIREFY